MGPFFKHLFKFPNLSKIANSVLCIGIALFVCGILFTSIGGFGFTVIRPPSLPAGVYQNSLEDTLKLGHPVHVCVGGHGAKIALAREYTKRSPAFALQRRCGADEAPMSKILVAQPGDTVTVIRDSVKINSRDWLHAPMAEFDRLQRGLLHATGEFILADGECYALSLYSPASFDSRYYGPLDCPTLPAMYHIPTALLHVSILDSLRIVSLGLHE